MPRKKPAAGGGIILTRAQAIVLMCLDCMGGDWNEVFGCPADGQSGYVRCPLWDIRPIRRHDALRRKLYNKRGERARGPVFTVARPTRKRTAKSTK